MTIGTSVKLDDRWQVDRVLGSDMLAEAHPYTEPSGAAHARAQLAWVVAREVEERVHAEHPGTAIYPANGYSVLQTYSWRADSAEATAAYRLGDSDEKIVLELSLERRDDGWHVASVDDREVEQAGVR